MNKRDEMASELTRSDAIIGQKSKEQNKKRSNGFNKENSFKKRRKCLFCKKSFNPKRKNQKFCSPNHRKRYWDKKNFIKLLGNIFYSTEVEKAIKQFME